jgi:ribosome-binding protein aMBF1 (putative translation factor)
VESDDARGGTSPTGHSIGQSRRRRLAASPEYREAYESLSVARQVARQVLEYRLDNGLTQQALSNLIGTSVPQLSRIESGAHNPTLKTLQRLATVMGKQLSIRFVEANPDEDEETKPPHEDARDLFGGSMPVTTAR